MTSEWRQWVHSHPLRPIPGLAYRLFRAMLFTGPAWIIRLIRLVLFGLTLMPVWLQMGWFYLTCNNIRRNIRYGPSARNYADVCFPDEVLGQRRCPVVIFFTGGAWCIGYKAWGVLLARILLNFGIVCVLPDYRNFPQGNIDDMLVDFDRAMQWTVKNIRKYGGDPNRIYVIGQSAGAQLFSTLMLSQARRESEIAFSNSSDQCQLDESSLSCAEQHPSDTDHSLRSSISSSSILSPSTSSTPTLLSSNSSTSSLSLSQLTRTDTSDSSISWRPSQLCAFIGMSGPYDIVDLQSHLHQRGLHRSVLAKIFNGTESFDRYSPTLIVSNNDWQQSNFGDNLPPIYLLHGDADQSCPASSSMRFARALSSLKRGPASVVCKVYHGKSHTDPIIEDLVHLEIDTTNDMASDIAAIVLERSDLSEFALNSISLSSSSSSSLSSLSSSQLSSTSSTCLSTTSSTSAASLVNNSDVSIVPDDVVVAHQSKPSRRRQRQKRKRPSITLEFYDDPFNPPSVFAGYNMLPKTLIRLARWVNPF